MLPPLKLYDISIAQRAYRYIVLPGSRFTYYAERDGERDEIRVQEGDITFTPHGSYHGSWCEEGENYRYIWFELCTDGYPGNIS